jgi:hypothetical protein
VFSEASELEPTKMCRVSRVSAGRLQPVPEGLFQGRIFLETVTKVQIRPKIPRMIRMKNLDSMHKSTRDVAEDQRAVILSRLISNNS